MSTLTIMTTGVENYLDGGDGKIKLLLAGPPSAGKTLFSAGAPRPIIAACEEGVMTLSHVKRPYARISSSEDMEAFLTLLETECRKPADQRRFETVVIDTLDAYQRTVTQAYLAKMKKEAMSGFDDWGYLDTKMTNLVYRLFLLPMNVIVLVHTKDKEIDKTPYTELKLKGDIRDQIPADFDFVGLMQMEFGSVPATPPAQGMVQGVKRKIRWQPLPHAQWLKCRGDALTETPVPDLIRGPIEGGWKVIEDGLRALLPGLASNTSEVVEQVTVAAPQPVPVAAGGPVAAPSTARRSVAKSATPAQAPATATPPATAAPATPPRPAVVAPPPAARRPILPAQDAANPPSMEEAKDTAARVLGATEIATSTEAAPENEGPSTPVGAPAEDVELPLEETPTPQTDAGATAPVEPPADPPVASEQAPAEQGVPAPAPASPVEVPQDGTVTVVCGQARHNGGTPKNPEAGCGLPLTVTFADGRVTGAEEGQDASLIEIAGLRERALLHNACFAQARAAR